MARVPPPQRLSQTGVLLPLAVGTPSVGVSKALPSTSEAFTIFQTIRRIQDIPNPSLQTRLQNYKVILSVAPLQNVGVTPPNDTHLSVFPASALIDLQQYDIDVDAHYGYSVREFLAVSPSQRIKPPNSLFTNNGSTKSSTSTHSPTLRIYYVGSFSHYSLEIRTFPLTFPTEMPRYVYLFSTHLPPNKPLFSIRTPLLQHPPPPPQPSTPYPFLPIHIHPRLRLHNQYHAHTLTLTTTNITFVNVLPKTTLTLTLLMDEFDRNTPKNQDVGHCFHPTRYPIGMTNAGFERERVGDLFEDA
ncbi:hypothetical protein D9758_010105 [Tetrapyrgos nigripes]|uniref:Uncharacterized protein n=1 Tax=Tetrapyrgos nigripes TaxID=182062 RepID=A0A8H5CSD3_9AGAR|nr:hypothetical protein D9758_010105 [Tetrapyrgos nigripes]